MSNQYNVDDILNEIKAKKARRTKPLHVLLTDRNLIRHADRLLKTSRIFRSNLPLQNRQNLQNQRKKTSFPSILTLSLFRKLFQQENQKHRYRPFLFRNVLLKKENRNLLPVLVPFPDQNLFLLIQ